MTFRKMCFVCFQPSDYCYCALIKKFNPGIKFVILIHPIERKRRIATGRMAHLCLENSELILGEDYSAHPRINALLQDSRFYPMILYPGKNSKNLSQLSVSDRSVVFPFEKMPLIFIVDGTWSTARKTMRLSENLKGLPQICFTPQRPSDFRVRKQPKAECYSTLEAVHHTLELFGSDFGLDMKARPHDNLLHVFKTFVDRQWIHFKDGTDSRATRSKSFQAIGAVR